MRPDLFEQMMRKVFLEPRLPTPRDIEAALRQVLAHDPLRAERAVGSLYGSLFKKAEARYDAAGPRR